VRLPLTPNTRYFFWVLYLRFVLCYAEIRDLAGGVTNMLNPFVFRTDQAVVTLGRIFGAPVKIQGWSWLPVNQLVTLALFTWQSLQRRAGWPLGKHLLLGAARMSVFLGSEWCHNLAHVAAARAVGQPVDGLRIYAGMPILLYDQPEHPSITPRQHILRSAAGPLCNVCLLALSRLFQRATRPGSPAREVADTAAGMNAFIVSGALLPVAEFDGGPVAKWSLAARGVPAARAARILRRANQALGLGLAGAALAALRRRRGWMALLYLLLGAICLVNGLRSGSNPAPQPAETRGYLVERR